MIIIWQTGGRKPSTLPRRSGRFSSYYQYNTVTKEITVIDLSVHAKGGGFFAYARESYFGLYKNELDIGKTGKWGITPEGELTYIEKPSSKKAKMITLSTEPKDGLISYYTNGGIQRAADISEIRTSGWKVTSKPYFPEDIRTSHLSLIANEAGIKRSSKSSLEFIDPFTAEEKANVSEFLKINIEKILGRPKHSFASISDADILNKLKGQLKEISNINKQKYAERIDEAIQSAIDFENGILEKMESLGIPPTEEFRNYYGEFISDLRKAHIDASIASPEGTRSALEKLRSAERNIRNATSHMSDEMKTALREEFSVTSGSVREALRATRSLNQVETFEPKIDNINSLDEYEEGFSDDTVDPVEELLTTS